MKRLDPRDSMFPIFSYLANLERHIGIHRNPCPSGVQFVDQGWAQRLRGCHQTWFLDVYLVAENMRGMDFSAFRSVING